MLSSLRRLLQDDSGAVLTEYGLVLALLSGAAMVGTIAIAVSANAEYTNMANSMQSFQLGTPP